MPDNALRLAVSSIVELLRSSQIQLALSHFRTALLRNEKNAAGDQLHAVSTKLVAAFKSFNDAEKKVCTYMHLDSMGQASYWEDLIALRSGLEPTRAEVVQLYSRILFASNHLPGLLALMSDMEGASSEHKIGSGRSLLEIRLVDAGEKAADPDRISRTIDGVDMVYTACVNMARKPAVDLSLVSISGTTERELKFEGDTEGVNAVKATIELIGDELSEVEDIETFQPEQLVASLPVFEDLQTLLKLGSFRRDEVDEISRSMREGCLLVLESGALLKAEELTYSHDKKVIVLPVEKAAPRKNLNDIAADTDSEPTVKLKKVDFRNEPAAADEHSQDESPDKFYQQYLKEKGRLEAGQSVIEDQLVDEEDLSDEAIDKLMSDIDRLSKN